MKTLYTIAADGPIMLRDRFGKLIRVRKLKHRGQLPPHGAIPVKDVSTHEVSWVHKSSLRKWQPKQQ